MGSTTEGVTLRAVAFSEALLRIRTPEGRVVSAGDIVPAIERIYARRSYHVVTLDYDRAEDSAQITVRFENGAYGTLQVSAVCWEGTDFNQTHHLDLHVRAVVRRGADRVARAIQSWRSAVTTGSWPMRLAKSWGRHLRAST